MPLASNSPSAPSSSRHRRRPGTRLHSGPPPTAPDTGAATGLLPCSMPSRACRSSHRRPRRHLQRPPGDPPPRRSRPRRPPGRSRRCRWRDESLRTIFPADQGRPYQCILPADQAAPHLVIDRSPRPTWPPASRSPPPPPSTCPATPRLRLVFRHDPAPMCSCFDPPYRQRRRLPRPVDAGPRPGL